MQAVTIGEPFDDSDFLLVCAADRCDAGESSLAVHQDYASAAPALTAALLGTCEMEILSQDFKQGPFGIGFNGSFLAVDNQSNFGIHSFPPQACPIQQIRTC